jgi:predicted MFS family arabinose efflux permease
MPMGILSPLSSARMITNCPGRAVLAILGARKLIKTILGTIVSFLTISYILLFSSDLLHIHRTDLELGYLGYGVQGWIGQLDWSGYWLASVRNGRS